MAGYSIMINDFPIDVAEFIERLNNHDIEVVEISWDSSNNSTLIRCELVPYEFKQSFFDEFVVTKLIHEYKDNDRVSMLVNDWKQDHYYIVHEKGLNVLDNLDKEDLLKFKDRKLARKVCNKLNEVKR